MFEIIIATAIITAICILIRNLLAWPLGALFRAININNAVDISRAIITALFSITVAVGAIYCIIQILSFGGYIDLLSQIIELPSAFIKFIAAVFNNR